jgi:hypothetical protein
MAEEVVREAAKWTQWWRSWSGRRRHGPDGGGGAEKKTSVSGGGGGAFIIQQCDNNDRVDGESAAWTWRWQ